LKGRVVLIHLEGVTLALLISFLPVNIFSSLPIVLLTFLGSIALIVAATRIGIYSAISLLAKTLSWRSDTVGKLLGYVTSFPELITTIYLALAGLYISALYNIMASNVINIFLAFGVMLIVFKKVSPDFLRSIHMPTLALTIVVPSVLIFYTAHTSYLIFVVIVLTIFYFSYLLYTRQKLHEPASPVAYHLANDAKQGLNHVAQKVVIAIFMLTGGLVTIIIAGDLFSLSSQILITEYGAPELIIGIITGIATSLPEMTTFYISAKSNKENPAEAHREIGHNLLASNAGNIFVGYNIALILVLLL
jgi:Ca2+/Na+ antiporter